MRALDRYAFIETKLIYLATFCAKLMAIFIILSQRVLCIQAVQGAYFMPYHRLP